MTKQEALNIVLNCSKIYHKNLENRNVIFIYQKEYNKYDYKIHCFNWRGRNQHFGYGK